MAYALYFDKEVKEKWNETWAKRTIERELCLMKNWTELLKLLDKYLTKDMKILEAGCGLGRYLLYLSNKGFGNIYGVDYSPNCISRLKKYAPDLRIMIGNVESLPFKNEYFDAYLSLGVLEHTEEGPMSGLNEACRVLKKNGVIIITGPCYAINLYSRFRRVKDKYFTPYFHICKRILRNFYKFKKIRKWIKSKVLNFRLGDKSLKANQAVSNKYFYEYNFSISEMKDFLIQAGFCIQETDYVLMREFLWKQFRCLRHPASKRCSDYNEVITNPAINPDEYLNLFGKCIDKFIKRFAPIVFAYAWIIVARRN